MWTCRCIRLTVVRAAACLKKPVFHGVPWVFWCLGLCIFPRAFFCTQSMPVSCSHPPSTSASCTCLAALNCVRSAHPRRHCRLASSPRTRWQLLQGHPRPFKVLLLQRLSMGHQGTFLARPCAPNKGQDFPNVTKHTVKIFLEGRVALAAFSSRAPSWYGTFMKLVRSGTIVVQKSCNVPGLQTEQWLTCRLSFATSDLLHDKSLAFFYSAGTWCLFIDTALTAY